MSDGNETGAQPPAKKTVLQFAALMTKPFELDTEGLGAIVSRSLTVKGASTFDKRLTSLDGVEDADLVRTYMGCVSGIPVPGSEAMPEPLSLEQTAQLTDADVLAFAQAYLSKIVKKEAAGDPLKQLAEFIREERVHHIEGLRKVAESIKAALGLHATAGIMKEWQGLSKAIQGPIAPLQNEMAKLFGPLADTQSSIADALRGLRAAQDAHDDIARIANKNAGMFDAIKHAGIVSSDDLVYAPFPTIDPIRFPEMPEPPPEAETPMGRTAIAVEQLGGASQRMEEAMGYIVKSAGQVADLIGNVSATIKDEAGRLNKESAKHTRHALWLAAASLAVSALALVISAYFSGRGYSADRSDALASGKDAKALIQEVQQQNKLMRDGLDKQRQQSAVLAATQQAAQEAAKAANEAAAALHPPAKTVGKSPPAGGDH